MEVLAIIPARGGSKGVPGKNKQVICGKPLVSYSIEAALESKKISEIWVSSDDEEILMIASGYKSITLHKRPASLASDTSPVTETVSEILGLCKKKTDLIVLLQPTSPIRTGSQIDEAIDTLLRNPSANSLISVCSMSDVHPARMYWMNDDELNPILPEYETTRRQEIPAAYYRNGSIYITRADAFAVTGSMMSKPAVGYLMPSDHLLNIDDKRDIIIAESLIAAWKKGII